MDDVPECLRVKMEGRHVSATNVKRAERCSKGLLHAGVGLLHQHSRYPAFAIRSKNGQGGDVPMSRSAIVFVHLGKDVADYLAFVVFRHMNQLRPGEVMVHVVLQLIALKMEIMSSSIQRTNVDQVDLLLRQAPKIRILDLKQILRCSLPNAHHCSILQEFKSSIKPAARIHLCKVCVHLLQTVLRSSSRVIDRSAAKRTANVFGHVFTYLFMSVGIFYVRDFIWYNS